MVPTGFGWSGRLSLFMDGTSLMDCMLAKTKKGVKHDVGGLLGDQKGEREDAKSFL